MPSQPATTQFRHDWVSLSAKSGGFPLPLAWFILMMSPVVQLTAIHQPLTALTTLTTSLTLYSTSYTIKSKPFYRSVSPFPPLLSVGSSVIFLYLSVYICLSVCIYLSFCLYLSFYLAVHIFRSVCLSVSVYLFVCGRSVFLSPFSSVCLFHCLADFLTATCLCRRPLRRQFSGVARSLPVSSSLSSSSLVNSRSISPATVRLRQADTSVNTWPHNALRRARLVLWLN